MIFDPCPPCGRQGRPGKGFLAGSILRAAGERPPRARPQRRGSPGPIPNPAVKPAFAESTAAQGCGRAGRRARGGRFSFCARRTRGDARRRRRMPKARRGGSPCGPSRVSGLMARPHAARFALAGCVWVASPAGISPVGSLLFSLRSYSIAYAQLFLHLFGSPSRIAWRIRWSFPFLV